MPERSYTWKRPKPLELLRLHGDLVRLFLLAGALFAALSIVSPDRFLSAANLESMAFRFPELALLSLAMMVVMLTGGIDLSAVAIANLSGILAALILTGAIPDGAGPVTTGAWIAVAIAVAVVCGATCGTLNGWLVSRVGVSPILATLGTMQLFSGLALVITGGPAVSGYPEPFLFVGNGTLFGIPVPFVVFAAAACALAVLTHGTSLGIRLRLLGTNPTAAVFAGIPVRPVLLRAYMTSGTIAGIAGLLLIARSNSAKADYGSSYLLQAILVAVLGGVHPAGGFGSVVGVSTAVLALECLASGFTMLQFSNFSREFTWGVCLLAVMVLNSLSARRQGG